ncbi:fimbrial protein [Yersinia pestis]|uniref:fimbrial protein n=1 Tax=Yersinia pestis TaxID=632 RepID=UPI0005E71578|nr:fimbrial protein [Yersinia pestis]KJG85049.1 fimbrial protein [Yersinia pestis subsp. microtus bv. Ulegeica]KJG85211.1 fimbrial protein [Yersinia pestis subsp. microtus bv. Ulegeica]KPD43461.1 fimbrial protein [Yersinia pestis subsp. microtus bv. Ulegeica]KPE15873.1 fimbrial protein [Yersinia pestis subsp. microtus bv. Ulegeica]PRH53653.1 fimbrial protein [Yersinia pestis]
MTRKLFILVFGAAISGQVNASCTLHLVSNSESVAGVMPLTFPISSFTFTIDADAPNDSTVPILEKVAQPQGLAVIYYCTSVDRYGKNVGPVLGQDLGNGLFATNIDGIAIKPAWNNGAAYGYFNSSGIMPAFEREGVPTEEGFWSYPATSHFRFELYKIKDTLNLTDTNGERVLPGGTIAYTWATNNSLANYAQRLEIGEIKVISTPSCTFDGPQKVDFGIVTSSNLNNGGIERDLDFNITCKTDYGHYSATAAIFTQTSSADNNYIKVKDSQNQEDRLLIKISDTNGQQMKVNGSTTEQQVNIASGVPAEFKWKAKLEAAPAANKPAIGNFSAMAEIILQIK